MATNPNRAALFAALEAAMAANSAGDSTRVTLWPEHVRAVLAALRAEEPAEAEVQRLQQENARLQAARDAFDAGQAASLDGQPRTANPHSPGDSYGVNDLWAQWDDGYDCNINRALKAEVASLRAHPQATCRMLQSGDSWCYTDEYGDTYSVRRTGQPGNPLTIYIEKKAAAGGPDQETQG